MFYDNKKWIFNLYSILLFYFFPNRLNHPTSKVLFSLLYFDCYLTLTLAPLKIFVLPDYYLIMMVLMSTMKSQLLALLTFLVVLLWSGAQAVTQFINSTTFAATLSRLLLCDRTVITHYISKLCLFNPSFIRYFSCWFSNSFGAHDRKICIIFHFFSVCSEEKEQFVSPVRWGYRGSWTWPAPYIPLLILE